jgi:hypothetical protein
MKTDVKGADLTPATSQHFAELSVVALTRLVQVDKKALPAGALGTVDQPFHALVTLEAGDLRP